MCLSQWQGQGEDQMKSIIVALISLQIILVKSYLNKLIFEVLETIKTDRGHVTILHGDGAFSLFVLPEEREILQKKILLAQVD